MRLRVLGCSGGIGGRHLRTTSFLVDSDILIDCGTGVTWRDVESTYTCTKRPIAAGSSLSPWNSPIR